MIELQTHTTLPDFVPAITKTFVIPIANTDTAPMLITLAEKLMQGEHGQLILLSVQSKDSTNVKKRHAFQEMTERAQLEAPNLTIKLEIVISDDIISSILETAEQYCADMILLGLSYSIRGQVELGRIVETVAERAPCDVAVFRAPNQSHIDRIVVPVGGSIASTIILQMGITLSKGYALPCETLHIYSATPERDAYHHVEDLLSTIHGHEKVKINVEHGVNEANSVLSWTNSSDLMVIGFSQRHPIEKWLYGDTAQRILDRARGPVLMVARAIDDKQIQARAKRHFSWIRPLLTQNEQEHIVWLAKDTVLPTLDYFVLLVTAAVIASFGLLLNSSAVVIGAMLVAPLMQPIIALGVGLCTARLNLMRKASVTVGLSVLMAIAVGIIIGVILPPDTPTKEMLARAYPSMLDAGVALASGFIAAYATARKDIPAALAGVAIAAALVPPLCSVGLSIALLEPRLAIGALLLFITNLLAIMAITAVVFFWMGMRPTRLNTSTRRRRYSVLIAGLLMMFVVIGSTLNYTHLPSVERISETRLQSLFEPAQLVNLQIQQNDPLLVIATLRTPSVIEAETVRMAQVMLSDDLETPVRLRIIIQQVIDGSVD